MFKKTLMAAALAAATGSAFAGEISVSGTAYKVGNEYLGSYTGSALQGDLSATNSIVYKAGIALGINNTLKFVFSGGAISANTGLQLYSVDNTAAAASDAALNTAVDTAIAAVADSGDQAADLAAMKAAALAVIAAAEGVTNSAQATLDINAVTVGANYAADVAAVQAAVPVLVGTPDSAIADLVDFGADADGNYEWVLFKLTAGTDVEDALLFAESDATEGANVVTLFTKETIGAGDLTIAMPEAKDDTGADLSAPVAAAKTLVTTANQFAITATTVEDTIDVEQERLYFVDTTAAQDTTGTFTFDVTEDATIDLKIDAATAEVAFEISGSLVGVDSVDLVDSAAIAADDSAAFDDDNMVEGTGIEDATITITVDGETNLATRTVGLTVMVTPAEADTEAFYILGAANSASDAFEWDLNGSEITFPYAPIGYDHVTTNFEVANSGDQEGDILVTAFGRDGATYSGTLAQTAEPSSLVKVSEGDIMTALGMDDAASLSITFSTTAPDADIKATGYSNLASGGRMALLSDAYEGESDKANCVSTVVVNNDGTVTETTDVTITCN